MFRWIFFFDDPRARALKTEQRRSFLGGKGAGLVEMTQLGLPVPPGFILSTDLCRFYYAHNGILPPDLVPELREAIHELQNRRRPHIFGDHHHPLLLSVRSGARASMPGMMDTILNLGLNDATVQGLATSSGNPRFAIDSYRRFIQMYGNVVANIDIHIFEKHLQNIKTLNHRQNDGDLSADDLRILTDLYKNSLEEHLHPFPQDVHQQLIESIEDVIKSWLNPRASAYRNLYGLDESEGTAVIVQSMVFGNHDHHSGTGVAFTRNPNTGEARLFGEYLPQAQGEDLVAGLRTPQPIEGISNSLKTHRPDIYQQLVTIQHKLENYYTDMQDIEFTLEKGTLWILQTRSGKRTVAAALKIAADMVAEGLLTQEAALKRLNAKAFSKLWVPQLTLSPPESIAEGLPASPGAAAGCIALSTPQALAQQAQGHRVILVRYETSAEDIQGMIASEGVVTARGGMTSHAAVIARGMGKPCVVGSPQLKIDFDSQTVIFNEKLMKPGDFITLDGGSGKVFEGDLPLSRTELPSAFATVMAWADSHRQIGVRANAETPQDISTALSLGAEGIGLCRSEHMFFEASRLHTLRQLILDPEMSKRSTLLAKLQCLQTEDFEKIFQLTSGKALTVRLLDPPLHEFLPSKDTEIAQLAESMSVKLSVVKQQLNQFHEHNPMLGHRGCRLGITMPDLYDCQVAALSEAFHNHTQRSRLKPPILEIMIPFVVWHSELQTLIKRLRRQTHNMPNVRIGTMIELPRAALIADQLAKVCDFISFGTNDLTQTTLGISRDDSASFLQTYIQKGLVSQDPFTTIDLEGVGSLITEAIKKARKTNPAISIGVCGEHGGDPESIAFFHKLGVSYVSCSPYRVPTARLAAAQAALSNPRAHL